MWTPQNYSVSNSTGIHLKVGVYYSNKNLAIMCYVFLGHRCMHDYNSYHFELKYEHHMTLFCTILSNTCF